MTGAWSFFSRSRERIRKFPSHLSGAHNFLYDSRIRMPGLQTIKLTSAAVLWNCSVKELRNEGVQRRAHIHIYIHTY